MKIAFSAFVVFAFLLMPHNAMASSSCGGSSIEGIKGLKDAVVLKDKTILGYSKIHINIDGYGKAYHPKNADAGALIHLCNAGEVNLPDGKKYDGSVSNETCTGKFMQDVAKIKTGEWKDPSIGAVRWYGILGKESAKIHGEVVKGVVPVEQADGSGFFVSPTTLADTTISDVAVQRRYVHPLRVPAAVIPNNATLSENGVVMGSFGVAIRKDKKIAVPFVVGDGGPRVGEGTPALARALEGLPITDNVTRKNRFAGQQESGVLWVFFGKNIQPAEYKADHEADMVKASQDAFAKWGGQKRLEDCLK
ncbi:hypothetical protein [Rhizobium leguminosarum]|uniref:hypothetical protein n=1 Tax=Rhizobium leguminosarum TaxID=384 RepID=UPI00103A80E7|nr:hypothetical protein [Rhizobium leguminosarum]TBZ22539.1 hypothetical protein E0H38_11415 [Rhizobium leguminosarum bv. viciae]